MNYTNKLQHFLIEQVIILPLLSLECFQTASQGVWIEGWIVSIQNYLITYSYE